MPDSPEPDESPSSKDARRTYRVVREWSIQKADFTYSVYRTTYWTDKEETTSHMGSGDRDWAEKNASHFNVSIEDE